MMWEYIGAIVVIAIVLFIIWAARYTKCGPNEVLIISGSKRKLGEKVVGYRIIRGGGTFVWPIKEVVHRMSMELMNLEVRTPEVYSLHGVPITVEATAQVKVKGDDESIIVAAEQFLSRSRDDIMKTALQVIEGHMRATISTLTPEEIYQKRKELADKVKAAASSDLGKMGLEIISLTIRSISDSQGYLDALGKPRTAQVKRDALIGEARADEEAKTFRYQADIKIEEARRDFEIKKAECESAINQRKAESDLSYDLQKYKTAQLVKQEEIKVGIVEKELSAELAEKEIARKEKELLAEVVKPAEAERKRIETIALAEKFRVIAESDGESESIRSKGFAEADVIKQKGSSEAETMQKKAEAWSDYNEAAVIEMFVNVLPKMAEAVALPLSKTEKIVVVSSDGGSAGASKITRDVVNVIAQLPPVVESLTGVKLEELVKRIPELKVAVKKEEK
ncbi:MAG: SPFH domain-containing protein [Halobacteria archaeon]